jgi:hypothetical protein
VSRPAHVPPRTQSFSGHTPVRFEGAPGGPFEGDGKWRGCRDFEHSTLCRVFGLDPVRFYFDLPSTVRGIGPNNAGGARVPGGRRQIGGFVMMAGRDEPVAKITICFDGERFADRDPLSQRDFFDLSRS